MESSESIASLAAALSAFQAEAVEPQKDGKNPHLRNRYVTLAGAWSTIRPLLGKHGLSVVQMPGGDGQLVSVTTQLSHSSGEWLRETACLPVGTQKGLNDAQVMGSAISYLRRYALLAVLGLSHDDDDAASAGGRKPSSAAAADPAPQASPIFKLPAHEAFRPHQGKDLLSPVIPRKDLHVIVGRLEKIKKELGAGWTTGQEHTLVQVKTEIERRRAADAEDVAMLEAEASEVAAEAMQ